MHIVELAACMAPARDLHQRRFAVGRGWPIEPVESRVAVGMQEPATGAEQRLCMDALAIGRVKVDRSWRNRRTPRPLITHCDPEPPGPGLAGAGGEHRDGGVVGVQHAAGADMAADCLGQGGEQELGLADPVGEGCAVKFNAFARIDDRLAVQRGVVGEFGDQDVGDQAGAGPAAFDRQ